MPPIYKTNLLFIALDLEGDDLCETRSLKVFSTCQHH